MESNFSKSAKNAAVAAFSQILTLFLSFVTRSLFIKYLSVDYLGIGGLFSNILTILSFSELGIGNVMIYSLYEPLKKNDKCKLRSLLVLYKRAYRYIASFITVVGILIAPFIELLIKTKPEIPEDIRILFLLFLANTVASYFCTYKKSVLLADQKTYVTNFVASAAHVLMVLAQIAVLYFFRSYLGYLACQIIFTFLINIVLTGIVNKEYAYIFRTEYIALKAEDKQTIFKNIKALAISKISGIVSSGTDNIIISKMFGLSPVGLVSNYTLVINSINNIFYNAFTSISSSIGNFNVDSSLLVKRKVFDEIFLLVYFVYSFICCCTFSLIQPFISLWIGEKYILSDAILINLLLGIYIGGMNYPVYSFRTTSGYFTQVQYIYVACALSNIVLSIALGKICGVAGVFAATWISKFLLTEIADSYFSYHIILKRKTVNYFIKYLGYFVVLACNSMICRLTVSAVPVSGWLGLIIKAIICGLLNIIINLIVFYHKDEFKSIANRILALIGRKRKRE